MRLKTEFIKDTFYQWAKANAPGVPVIFADQSGPQPQCTYITLKIISGPRRVGSTDELRYKLNDVFTVVGLREMTLSVQAFGAGAIDILSALNTSFSLPDVISFFNVKNIGIVSEGDIRDLTALSDTTFEERAQMDVRIYASDELDAKVGYIGGTKVEGELDNQGSDITTDQTIPAP